MKTTAIIQARMGSSRLPGKVLLPLAGRPAIDHVLERVRAAREVELVVVATSSDPGDDPIADHCSGCGIPFVRGSETDVLSRYLLALETFPTDIAVRITADCPLTDPNLIDSLVSHLKDAGGTLDYHSNTLPPRRIPHGLDVEVFSSSALQRAGREAHQPEEREHVTPYLYRHPELFRVSGATLEADLSHHRWTLDTEADRDLLDRILTAMPRNRYRWQDTLALLDTHPSWVSINSSIRQKVVES